MKAKTYTNAELADLVNEFSAEFDALVKAEVTKTGQALNKSEAVLAKEEGGGDDEGKDGPPSDGGSESSDSAPAESAESAPAAPPGPDAGSAPAPDASASAPAADPASAGAPAGGDPSGQAAGTDPVQALVQAYAQLSPEELAMHDAALQQVKAQSGAAAGGMPGAPGAGGMPPADPMAAGAGAPPAPGPVAPAPAPAAPAGPAAVAPLAGEGSQPIDPAATMALKSEFDKELNLIKSERDAKAKEITDLKKSVEMLTDAMTKVFAQPVRRAITSKDVGALSKAEKPVSLGDLSKAEITRKLTVAAHNPSLKKSDRDLINNYYKGNVKVDALAHLLG
jgi:hypothetical protein